VCGAGAPARVYPQAKQQILEPGLTSIVEERPLRAA